MEQFRFLKWRVYHDAKELFSIVLAVVAKLPKEYRFELGSQIIRSALSILLNIAEGSGKHSDKELNRFIEISLGSVYETVAAADTMRDNRLIRQEVYGDIEKRCDDIARQLGGLKKKLVR